MRGGRAVVALIMKSNPKGQPREAYKKGREVSRRRCSRDLPGIRARYL